MKKLFICLFVLIIAVSIEAHSQRIASIRYFESVSFDPITEHAQYNRPITEEDVKYKKNLWKVYYDSAGRTIGEEYYVNQRVEYYAIYFRDPDGTYRKQWYYWHGIRAWALADLGDRYLHYGFGYYATLDKALYYDKDDKLLTKIFYIDGEINYFYIYHYDQFGRLYRRDQYNGGELVGTVTY